MSKGETDGWVKRSKELRKAIKSLGDKNLTQEELALLIVEIKANYVLFEAALDRLVQNA